MGRKVYCENTCCKHHGSDNKCGVTVRIGDTGKCQSFEKGFTYYVNLVWGALESKNYIDAIEMDDEMRIGMYYVMKIFRLQFSQAEWGLCRMFTLHDGRDGPALDYEQIIAREMDHDMLLKLWSDFDKGKLPGASQQEESVSKTQQPFGWLSPTGEFTEGDWGEHEGVAFEIIKRKHFSDEFKDPSGMHDTAREFLSGVKGYALIHNPAGFGGYLVSHEKPLTKAQREFLYDYFMEIGDRFRAECYFEGG